MSLIVCVAKQRLKLRELRSTSSDAAGKLKGMTNNNLFLTMISEAGAATLKTISQSFKYAFGKLKEKATKKKKQQNVQ